MKKKFLFLIMGALVLAGCKSGADSTSKVETESSVSASAVSESTDTTVPEAVEEATGEGTDARDALFEKKYYTFTNSSNTYCTLCEITNNSDETVKITARTKALNSKGEEIGTGYDEFEVFGPGETSMMVFRYSDVKDPSEVADVEYSFEYEPSLRTSVVKNIETELSIVKNGAIVRLTNAGDVIGTYPEVTVVFYDSNNEIVSTATEYVCDINGELRPGESLTKSFYGGSKIDHAVYFLNAGFDGNAMYDGSVSESDLEITEYQGTDPWNRALEALVIKNNSGKLIGVQANFTAYDASGKMIEAKVDKIDSFEPGDESVIHVLFDDADAVDHVEYVLSYDIEPYYHSARQDVSFTVEVNGDDVTATAVNNGEDSVFALNGVLLFFDAAGNLVDVKEDDFYNGSNFYPNEPASFMVIDEPADFASVKMYLTGGTTSLNK